MLVGLVLVGEGVGQVLSLVRILGHMERRLSQRLEVVLAVESVTVDQWRVLELLAEGRGLSMSTIAGQVLVPGATLTKLVDRLVDVSLVYRRVDDLDRRRVLVHLAEHGFLVYRRVRPKVQRVEREFLEALRVGHEDAVHLLEAMASCVPSTEGEHRRSRPPAAGL